MNLVERTTAAIEEGQRALIGKSQESPSGKALKACVTLLSEWLREPRFLPKFEQGPLPSDGPPVTPVGAPRPRKQKGLA